MSELHHDSRVPADHPALAGHFPGRPIVPGVVLLELVIAALALPPTQRVAAVASAKFLQPLLPEQDFRISWQVQGQTVRFRCATSEALLEQGVLSLQTLAE